MELIRRILKKDKWEEESYKLRKKVEQEKNKFSYSFGIVIVLIGILAFFTECSNNVLIGVSISSLLFTIFNYYFSENSRMNIIPLFALMAFVIFPTQIEKTPIIKYLLLPELNNGIVFISFGLTFIFNYKMSVREEIENAINRLKINNDILSAMNEKIEIIVIIKKFILNIKKAMLKKKIDEKSLTKEIDELENYTEEELFINSIESDLSEIGFDEEKVSFTFEEIEEVISKNRKYKLEYDKKSDEVINSELTENKNETQTNN